VTVFNGYPLSIVLAVLLHGSVLAALFYFQQADTEVIDIVRPPAVKALLVNENPQARNERVLQQREAQQQRQERQRQEAAQAERQRQEEQRRAQEQQAAEQRQQEQERLRAEQQRVAQEQRQREQQQREAEQQRQREQQQREAEQQRQQELAAEQERQRQEQAQAQARAQQEADASELAETEAELVMAYSAVIHDLVQQYWSRPPSARNGMVVVLRIRMVPTGDVLDVEIVQSSGDFAFDRAAESAVLKVNRFTELQGMEPRLFDRNFRTFLLTFRPQDLLN
jgi:colicin import membrane protein